GFEPEGNAPVEGRLEQPGDEAGAGAALVLADMFRQHIPDTRAGTVLVAYPLPAHAVRVMLAIVGDDTAIGPLTQLAGGERGHLQVAAPGLAALEGGIVVIWIFFNHFKGYSNASREVFDHLVAAIHEHFPKRRIAEPLGQVLQVLEGFGPAVGDAGLLGEFGAPHPALPGGD